MREQLLEAIRENDLARVTSVLPQIDKEELNKTDDYGNTILFEAVVYQADPDLLKLLLSKLDIDTINAANDENRTVLHLAVYLRNQKAIDILLHNMTPDAINIADKKGRTILDLASNSPEIKELILPYIKTDQPTITTIELDDDNTFSIPILGDDA